MAIFILRRLFALIPVLWGIATLIFALMFLVPGDPARLLMGQHGDEATLKALRRELGLDRPVHVQYGRFLERLVQGDLGRSYRQRRPVTEIIAERFPATLKLASAAVILATAFGMAAGLLAAFRSHTWIDNVVTTIALFGISMPVFWVGLLLILLFAAKLGWLPVAGFGEGGLRHLILPATALSFVLMGYIARMTRSSMLEVASGDYIRTAAAKGASPARIHFVHALRNAANPIVTIIGLNLAGLLGGAVATETVFAWPGLGRALVDAIFSRDLPVVEGCVIVLACVFVTVNLAVDCLYAILDPRISYDEAS